MIIGHQQIWQFLNHSFGKNRLAHAYLFVGPAEVGKKTVALEFIKNLQCQNPQIIQGNIFACQKCQNCRLINQNVHPDVLVVAPVDQTTASLQASEKPIKNQEIKIDQIRQIQRQITLSLFCAKYKAVIIDSAEQMTPEAQNCLLKTLEEPSAKSILILVSSGWQKLLPTIISRCQMIKFLPVPRQLIEKGLFVLGFKEKAKIFQAALRSCGRPGTAIKLLRQPLLLKEQTQAVADLLVLLKSDLTVKFRYAQKLSQNAPAAQAALDQWIIWFRDQMLESLGVRGLKILSQNASVNYPAAKISGAIKNIFDAKRLLAETGFNSRLIIENLLLKI